VAKDSYDKDIETIGRESMPAKKYKAALTKEERKLLGDILRKGNTTRKNGNERKRCCWLTTV
jgi:hypothetical protein